MQTEPAKNITVLLRSRESAERTIREILAKQIEREQLIAVRDAKIQTVRDKHDPDIDALSETIDRDFQLLEDWADNNPEEFGKARSVVISGCRLGWRTGQPAVKARGKLKLPTILKRIVEAGGVLKDRFVRTKDELNKEAILALQRVADGKDPEVAALGIEQREDAQTAARATLRDIGVEVVQGESFYLEPDREGQPDIRLSTGKEAA